MNETTKFFGLYRGTVVANIDPMQRGRIAVVCSDIVGSASVWAVPCFPITTGPSEQVVAPPVDSIVWLQFEAGDPDRAVWIGSLSAVVS